MKTRRAQPLFLMLVMMWSTMAAAETGNVPTQQFQPPPGGDGNFIGLMGSDVLGHMQSSFGATLNYAHKPLVFTVCPWCRNTALIRNQAAGDFLAAIGFFGMLELGVAVPITFFQNSDSDALELAQANVSRATIGDIRLVPKWQIYRWDGHGGIALAAIVSLPSGGQKSMQGNASATVEPRLIFDHQLHPRLRVATNVGYIVRKQQGMFNVDVGNEITYGLAMDLDMVKDRFSLIGEVAGKTAIDPDSVVSVETSPLEALFGLRYRTLGGHSFTAAAGPGLTHGYGSPKYRVVAGYAYTGPIDTDGDGCYDNVDPCPYDPEDIDGFEDNNCCPDPDNDRDQICDPWVSEKGLQSKYAAQCQGTDRCPDVSEDVDGFEDDDGCPDPDNDKDGICDPWVAKMGLSDQYASQCRGTDQCPDEPEVVNGFEDEDGCPDKKPLARVEGKKIVVFDVILFFFNKTSIKPESFPVIDAVVDILKENPQIQKIRIEGHTDLKGGVGYNKKLSQGRAAAVRQYLIEHGIEAGRLTSKGYGKSRPLVKPEKTPEDAQTNRRVEFIILQTADVAK